MHTEDEDIAQGKLSFQAARKSQPAGEPPVLGGVS